MSRIFLFLLKVKQHNFPFELLMQSNKIYCKNTKRTTTTITALQVKFLRNGKIGLSTYQITTEITSRKKSCFDFQIYKRNLIFTRNFSEIQN